MVQFCSMATIIKTVPVQIDYEHRQGDTWQPGTITCDVSGTVINFTGWTATMELRSAISNDVSLTLTSTPPVGITMTTLGVITLSMTAEQTKVLLGEYRYDLELTRPDGSIKTFTYGTITITKDTTENA